MKGLDLKPRAVAALCALRNGPLTTMQIRNAIGDPSTQTTKDLVSDMRELRLISYGPAKADMRLYLNHDGIGWLQTNGLDAVREARLWVAEEKAVLP